MLIQVSVLMDHNIILKYIQSISMLMEYKYSDVYRLVPTEILIHMC